MRRNPRVFFSFRSPFSWMAVERLQRAIPDIQDRLEFIPYWEPDARTREALQQRDAEIRYAPMSKAKHLYILQDTKRLAAELGLRIVWPVDVNPWWEASHLGWLQARRMGCGSAFYKAVTEARWLRGENISDPDVIRRLAESAGLDGHAIVQALDDPGIRAEGVEALVEAYQDDIFGVPYFRIGGHRFWGFDRVDRFIAELAVKLQNNGGHPVAGLPETNLPASVPANSPRCAVVPGLASIPVEEQAAHEEQIAREEQTGPFDNDTAGGCG